MEQDRVYFKQFIEGGGLGEFRLKCPKNYPLNCTLLVSEKESLERTEKFKAFLMYQFNGQDSYLVETIKSYFHTPTYYVFDAREEAGLGVKICKICRLALACDFGIAVITPLNHNVFLEVGFLMGLGKKSVYIVSRNILEKEHKTINDLPFDLSDQLVIEHSSEEELLNKLEKEIPQFIEPIEKITGYDKRFREYMKEKLQALKQVSKKGHAMDLLKLFILEQGKQGITKTWINNCISHPEEESFDDDLLMLEKYGLITSIRGKTKKLIDEIFYKLEESYRPFLRDHFWK